MISLSNLTRQLGVLALAGVLAACGGGLPPAAPSGGAVAKAEVRGNDCRSPNAQTTQKACKPMGYMVGGR